MNSDAPTPPVIIRKITQQDFKLFWPTFQKVVQAQETYAFDPDISFEDAYILWCEAPLKTYVFEEAGKILGSYYIKPNAAGPGAHICNCGYMVATEARGKGVARKLCEHSQMIAKTLNFKAMQFNAVAVTNEIAVKLWQKMGYQIIGTVPNAYNHKTLGYVDTYIMYKAL